MSIIPLPPRMRAEKVRQAVILAGGRGTRLRPMTEFLPKPMISFHGRPFLEYLICQLRAQGVRRILLLLGYLPDPIISHFGDGSRFGVEIEYNITDVEHDTGTRLRLAKSKIDRRFLLMYCDNYWPMRLAGMVDHFLEKKVMGLITVYDNRHGVTKDNIRVSPDGLVDLYDKSRSATDLKGVDIGYGIFSKKVLDLLPEENVNFEKTIYPLLVEQGQLAAFVSGHRYYSVSTPERLGATELFLSRRPAIILDRDGVLNVKPAKACYVTRPEDFVWLPGAIEAVKLLRDAGYLVLLASNQAGIARGIMTVEELDAIHHKMQRDLEQYDAGVDGIYYCPHGWDDGCECRKPNPGMLYWAQNDHYLDLSRTPFIGDSPSDMEAGERAGCPTYIVDENRSLLDIVTKDILKVNLSKTITE